MKLKNDNIIKGYEFPKDFIYFLKKNGAYKKYKYNFEELVRGSFKEYLLQKENLILAAFDWISANEGYAFWSNMNINWRNYQ